MILVRNMEHLLSERSPAAEARRQGTVVAIGNFDGIHRGHQAVLEQLRRLAVSRRLRCAAILFEPQPLEFLRPQDAPARVMTLRDKLLMLRESGVELAVRLRFDRMLATMTAERFVEEVLIAGLGMRVAVAGADFRFGRNRQGDFALLQTLGRGRGFEALEARTCLLAGARVSSTRLRAALQMGEMERACELLGRPYALAGRVARGAGRGRRMGYPTANVALGRMRRPVRGVFACRLYAPDGAWDGVGYVGRRPVFDEREILLETHLFDFNGDLYGYRVRVELLHRLRDELPFATADALLDRIRIDVRLAREYHRVRQSADDGSPRVGAL